MACRLLGAKALSEIVLFYVLFSQLDHWQHTSANFKQNTFY